MFDAGYARLCAAHRELSHGDVGAHARLLRLGRRLWREGRRIVTGMKTGRPEKAVAPPHGRPSLVQLSLEWLALRAALARRRAFWLTTVAGARTVTLAIRTAGRVSAWPVGDAPP